MKAIRLLFICCGLATGGPLHAQITATNKSGQVDTNSIGQERAKQLAAHLRLNMPEEWAKTFLRRNGLGFSLSFGDSFRWVDCFPLTNNTTFVLEIEPRKFRADGAWKDGRLKAASIRSNDVTLISFSLTNAP